MFASLQRPLSKFVYFVEFLIGLRRAVRIASNQISFRPGLRPDHTSGAHNAPKTPYSAPSPRSHSMPRMSRSRRLHASSYGKHKLHNRRFLNFKV